MRRRDVLFMGLIWGAALGGLAWALATQFNWVQASRPARSPQPLKPEVGESEAAAPSATGVIGNVSEDTMAAMAKGLPRQPPKKPDPKASAGSKVPPPK
jgi:hypothetical protein